MINHCKASIHRYAIMTHKVVNRKTLRGLVWEVEETKNQSPLSGSGFSRKNLVRNFFFTVYIVNDTSSQCSYNFVIFVVIISCDYDV